MKTVIVDNTGCCDFCKLPLEDASLGRKNGLCENCFKQKILYEMGMDFRKDFFIKKFLQDYPQYNNSYDIERLNKIYDKLSNTG